MSEEKKELSELHKSIIKDFKPIKHQLDALRLKYGDDVMVTAMYCNGMYDKLDGGFIGEYRLTITNRKKEGYDFV